MQKEIIIFLALLGPVMYASGLHFFFIYFLQCMVCVIVCDNELLLHKPKHAVSLLTKSKHLHAVSLLTKSKNLHAVSLLTKIQNVHVVSLLTSLFNYIFWWILFIYIAL